MKKKANTSTKPIMSRGDFMLPNNTDIEKSVLGCLALGKADYVIKLSENDFYNQANQQIFRAIKHLFEQKKEIDIITLSDELKPQIDNSLEMVCGLESYVATTENINHYISSLKQYTLRREIIKSADRAKDIALNKSYDNPIEMKNDILQLFDIEIYSRQKDDNSLYAIIMRTVQDIEDKYNSNTEDKYFTGFYDLDKLTAGLHPEELTILAARPGVGKTAYALQMMLQMAKKGIHSLFVSREMSQMQIAKRILANIATIDGQKLRLCKTLTDSDWAKIGYSVANEIGQLPIELNDKLSSVQEIRAYCRELKTSGKLDLLIVDYLQLCKSLKKVDNRTQEVADISRQLKEISLEFGIPVVALSQLTREGSKAGREPELHDLRESGSLEQDADNVIFLHVPDGTDETQDCFDIKVIVGKQRNGATGYIYLKYFRRTFKLCNIKS
jgi:replicative DNA helicase